MEKYLTGSQNYNLTDLKNFDWDVLELDVTVDHEKLMDWYRLVEKNISQAKFVMSPEYEEKYFDHRYLRRWYATNTCKAKDKYPYWFGLNWSKERYDPLPFLFLANKEIFPEIDDPNFNEDTNPVLQKYLFDEFSRIHEGKEDFFKFARLLILPKDSGLGAHKDVIPPEQVIRLHIQLQIHDECIWYFGDFCERQYVMQSGKMYLINTAVTHAAINYGEQDWVMIHSTPPEHTLTDLLNLSGKL